MLRDIANWVECISKADATYEIGPKAAARRIIGDLTGYRLNSQHREHDIEQLANALEAYAYLLQEAGVKVVK